jgi:hypothetical protein
LMYFKPASSSNTIQEVASVLYTSVIPYWISWFIAWRTRMWRRCWAKSWWRAMAHYKISG